MKRFFKLRLFLAVSVLAAMLPQAPACALENEFKIEFGSKLTEQEINGYAPLGGSVKDRFEQAVEELPEEVVVISPFEKNGQNIFYVSETGNDENDGLSENTSLKTVAEALGRVKLLSNVEKSKGSVIRLKSGRYAVSDTISITKEHCSDDAPLFISSYGGKAELYPSEGFSLSDMTKVTDSNTDYSDYIRIASGARDKLYYIDYRGFDFVSHNADVIYKDSSLKIARYPNSGYDAIKAVINGGYGKNCTWTPMDERPFSWLDTGDIRVYGKLCREWSFEGGKIRIDKNSGQLQGAQSLSYYDGPISKYLTGGGAAAYYYYNVFEELDVPGEWFADNKNKRLYIYPPDDCADMYYLCENDFNIFEISGSSNVVLDGIEIRGGKRGISVIDSRNIVIQNCNTGNTAEENVYMYNTTKCGVISSELSGGRNADNTIYIGESPERRTELLPKRNFVQNNIISGSNRAVVLINTGSIVSHNLIKNTNNSGIVFQGAENIIEYNELSGSQKRVSDSGAIYTGVNFTIRNNHIRYNYIHDARHDGYSSRGIYIDDCNDNEYVYGNVIKHYGYGIFLHGGDNHVVKDNVVIDVRDPIGNSYDYAVNGIHTNQMQDRYFVKGDVLSDYEKYNYNISAAWQKRYNTRLFDDYNAIKNAQVVFAASGSEEEAVSKIKAVVNQKLRNPRLDYEAIPGYGEVKPCVDVVVDSGCYYGGNKVVNCLTEPVYATSVGINNTEENNVCVTGADEEEYLRNSNYLKAGPVGETAVEMGKPVVYINNGGAVKKDGFSGFSWSGDAVADHYTVEIASDERFENTVVYSEVSLPEFSLYKYTCKDKNSEVQREKLYSYHDALTGEDDFAVDKPYYVRVTAVNSDENEQTVSEIYSFIIVNPEENKASCSIVKGNVSNYILIEGSLPHDIPDTDKKVNLLIYDGTYNKSELAENPSAIKQIIQLETDHKNCFSYKFRVNGADASSLRVCVRVGDEELREESFTAMVQSLTEITLSTFADEGVDGDVIAGAVASVNNMFNAIGKYKVIISEYNDRNTLIGCKYSEFDAAENVAGSIEYIPKKETSVIKAYVWQDMTPLINSQFIRQMD